MGVFSSTETGGSHIPYFAIGHPSSRENRFARLDFKSLPEIVGRRCAQWVTDHRDNIELISTKNYILPRTAFYARWLAFRDPAFAESFLEAWPR